MLIEKIKQIKKGSVAPVHSNRCSTIGHDCLRYLVYERTMWHVKPEPGFDLLNRFDIGKILERQTIIDLQQAGVDVILQQQSYYLKEYELSGKIDGKVVVDGKTYIIEIKSVDPYSFHVFRSAEDFLNTDKVWHRGWYHQLNMYLHMAFSEGEKVEGGIIILRSLDGKWKEIPMSYNPQKAQEVLQKCLLINEYVKKEEVPEPIYKSNPEKIKICLECAYKTFCLTEMPSMEHVIFEEANQEMIEKIKRLKDLEAYKKEYEALEEEIKSAFKPDKQLMREMLSKNQDFKAFVLGDYVVKMKLYWQTRYDIPEEIKKEYAQKEPACRITIE